MKLKLSHLSLIVSILLVSSSPALEIDLKTKENIKKYEVKTEFEDLLKSSIEKNDFDTIKNIEFFQRCYKVLELKENNKIAIPDLCGVYVYKFQKEDGSFFIFDEVYSKNGIKELIKKLVNQELNIDDYFLKYETDLAASLLKQENNQTNEELNNKIVVIENVDVITTKPAIEKENENEYVSYLKDNPHYLLGLLGFLFLLYKIKNKNKNKEVEEVEDKTRKEKLGLIGLIKNKINSLKEKANLKKEEINSNLSSFIEKEDAQNKIAESKDLFSDEFDSINNFSNVETKNNTINEEDENDLFGSVKKETNYNSSNEEDENDLFGSAKKETKNNTINEEDENDLFGSVKKETNYNSSNEEDENDLFGSVKKETNYNSSNEEDETAIFGSVRKETNYNSSNEEDENDLFGSVKKETNYNSSNEEDENDLFGSVKKETNYNSSNEEEDEDDTYGSVRKETNYNSNSSNEEDEDDTYGSVRKEESINIKELDIYLKEYKELKEEMLFIKDSVNEINKKIDENSTLTKKLTNKFDLNFKAIFEALDVSYEEISTEMIERENVSFSNESGEENVDEYLINKKDYDQNFILPNSEDKEYKENDEIAISEKEFSFENDEYLDEYDQEKKEFEELKSNMDLNYEEILKNS
jgi:hypothetical protein